MALTQTLSANSSDVITADLIAQYKEQGLFLLIDKEGNIRELVTLLDADRLWVHTPSLVFSVTYRVCILESQLSTVGPPPPPETVITTANATDPALAERVKLELDRGRLTRRLEYGAAGKSGLSFDQAALKANEAELAKGRTGRSRITELKETGLGAMTKRPGAGKPSTPIIEKMAKLYHETFEKGLEPPKTFAFYWNVSKMVESGSGITKAPNPTLGGPLKWYPLIPIASKERESYELAVTQLFHQLAEKPGLLQFEPYTSWAAQGGAVPPEVEAWIEETWGREPSGSNATEGSTEKNPAKGLSAQPLGSALGSAEAKPLGRGLGSVTLGSSEAKPLGRGLGSVTLGSETTSLGQSRGLGSGLGLGLGARTLGAK